MFETKRDETLRMRNVFYRNFCNLITEGQRRGEFNPSMDAKLSAMAILGMINWVFHWYAEDGPST